MSAESFSRLDISSLWQSFMLGLNRCPLTLPADVSNAIAAGSPEKPPALAALAMAGTRNRFVRRSPAFAAEPVPEAAKLLHDDRRPILPGQARRHLHRLLLKADSETARAIVGASLQRLDACGLRLHPFDLPRLAVPLRTCGVVPGVAERAYLALTQPATEDEPVAGLGHEAITSENWRSFGKAARVRFLTGLRAKDPAAGLALLQECLGQEPAALRCELVQTLSAGLSSADLTLLESLEKDRAESVRTAAASLLSLLPGTAAYNERLSRAGASLHLKQAKMLRKPKVLFTRPGGPSPYAVGAAIHALFKNIGARDLAARLDMSVSEFLEALPEDEDALLGALLATALTHRDTATAAALLPKLHGDAMDMLLVHASDLGALPEVRDILLHRFIARLNEGRYPRANTFTALLNRLDKPLPAEMASGLLASSGWRNFLAALAEVQPDRRKADLDSLLLTAMLLPAHAMLAFLADIEPLQPSMNRRATDFARFVLALQPAAHTAPGER